MNGLPALAALTIAAPLALTAGCQTTSSPAASTQSAATTAPVPTPAPRGNLAARVAFWVTEVARLQESLDQVEAVQKRFRMDNPSATDPLSLQVKRDQTVALLLRAGTELQNARFDLAMEQADQDAARIAELPSARSTAAATR